MIEAPPALAPAAGRGYLILASETTAHAQSDGLDPYRARPAISARLLPFKNGSAAVMTGPKGPKQRVRPDGPEQRLLLESLTEPPAFKNKVYDALKKAVTEMDIYSTPEPQWIDERRISEMLGVSRTPVREALAMLQREGFVTPVPRKGIIVVRKTKREVIEMVQAWAALESIAVRLITLHASDDDIAALRRLFVFFDDAHRPSEYLSEYSKANLDFHQALIRLSGSALLVDMTANLLLHVRGIRQITIGRDDRTSQSIIDHLAIIEAIERRDTAKAEELSREHTLGLARYVERHGDGILD
jgi:DNA-binding GntR family transcriptional regulator